MEPNKMKNDLSRIIDLKLQMYEEAGLLHRLAENPEGVIKKDYQSMYDAGTAKHFLKFEGDEIIAMAGAFIKDDIPFRYYRGTRYGFIGDVYVKPEHRKKGLATSLSRSCVQWLKEKNITMIRLLATEAGRPVYEKLGFAATDEMSLTL